MNAVDDEEESPALRTGEHPLVTVIQHKPLPGRRPFAFAFLLTAVAAIMATVLIAWPLWKYLGRQEVEERELICQASIGNALHDAQADLIDHLAAGLVIALDGAETTEIVQRIAETRTRVRELGDLRFQAVEICDADPSFRPPPTPT